MMDFKNKDINISKCKKIILIVPICLLILGIIMGIIFGATNGSPFNLGKEFTGSYSYTVKTGEYITDKNFKSYKEDIKTLFDEYSFEYSNKDYSVILDDISFTSDKKDSLIKISFSADKSLSKSQRDSVMQELNVDLKDSLYDIVKFQRPESASITGNSAVLKYSTPVTAAVDSGNLIDALKANGINATDVSFASGDDVDFKEVTVTFSGTVTEEDLIKAATIDRFFSITVMPIEMTTATHGFSLMANTIYVVIAVLALVIIFALIRFETASAFSIVSAVFIDVIMTVILTVVFHSQVTSAFIGSLAMVMIFSLISSILVFDRIREVRKSVHLSGENATATDVCNKSINHIKNTNMLVSTIAAVFLLVTMLIAAIMGATSIVWITLPMLFGVISSFFTALFVAPSLWIFLKQNKLGDLAQFRLGRQGKKVAKEIIPTKTEEAAKDTNN